MTRALSLIDRALIDRALIALALIALACVVACTPPPEADAPATPPDLERTVLELYRGCVMADGEACVRLAILVEGRDQLVSRHRQRLSDVLEHSCGTAYPRRPGACLAAGLLARACDLGEAPACGALAALGEKGTLERGGLGAMTPLELHGRACTSGWSESCEMVAEGLLRGVHRNPSRATRLLAAACEASAPRACVVLAERFARGDGAPVDLARARRLRAGACEAGEGEACHALARMERRGLGGERLGVEALVHLRRACELGALAACEDLGEAHELGAGMAEDKLVAFELYQKAARGYEERCEAGDVDACAALGARLRRSGNGPGDEARGRGLQREACERGSAAGCMGVMSRGRFFLPGKSEVVGGPALGRGCLTGDADACLVLGRVGERALVHVGMRSVEAVLRRGCRLGNGAACNAAGLTRFPPTPEGTALLQRGCQLGDALACHHLGLVFELPAASDDLGRAVKLHRRACGWDDASACTRLGTLRAGGGERGANPDAAATLFDRACRLGDAGGCFALGKMRMEGMRVAPDRKEGRELLERACRQRESAACAFLGGLLTRGRYVERDTPAGASLLREACEAGEPRACADLAELLRRGELLPKDEDRAAALLEGAAPRAIATCASAVALCHDGTPMVGGASWTKVGGWPARRLLGVPPCDAALERRCQDATDVAVARCEHGSASAKDPTGGCFAAAELVERLRGVGLAGSKKQLEAAAARGVDRLRRACTGGDSSACVAVAEAHRTGRGAKVSASREKHFRRQACRLDPTRCE